MKNIVERAVKTFIEAFIGSLVVLIPTADFSSSVALKSLLVSAIATGISAVLNLVQNYLENRKVK